MTVAIPVRIQKGSFMFLFLILNSFMLLGHVIFLL